MNLINNSPMNTPETLTLSQWAKLNPEEQKRKYRIYKKAGTYECYDITKNLKAFYDGTISIQRMWCMAFGKQVIINN